MAGSRFVRSLLGVLGGVALASAAHAQSWSTTGNAGTTPPTNFIGTTDNEPFEIHINNNGVMRFEEPPCNSFDCGFNLIGGKLGLDGNSVNSGVVGATVFGGGENFDFSILSNVAGGDFATISGGGANTASGGADVIGGGIFNSTNGGNLDPEFNNGGATVGGGIGNTATNEWATVPGGVNNSASGAASLAAGNISSASGFASFALGNKASAEHDGAFVWSDDSSDTLFHSLAANTFSVRATGGVRIVTGVSGSHISGVGLMHGSGSWASLSDRSAKMNLKPVDPRELLNRLSLIPITTWSYKTQDASVRHIGPMAQDFGKAFKVGEDDKHITAVDAEGVALAGIQGLYQMLKDKDAQIAELRTRINAIERIQAVQQAGAHTASAPASCTGAKVSGL